MTAELYVFYGLGVTTGIVLAVGCAVMAEWAERRSGKHVVLKMTEYPGLFEMCAPPAAPPPATSPATRGGSVQNFKQSQSLQGPLCKAEPHFSCHKDGGSVQNGGA